MEKSSFLENKRVERIKKILEREKISQKDLADALIDPRDPEKSMEPQNLSRMMKTGKITEKTCKRIVAAFPEYRIEWLLGIDDYMTARDAIDGFINRMDREHDDNIDTARHLAKLRNIEFNLYSSGIIQDENGRFLDCFLVRKDGKKAYITYNDLTDLISDLAALTESRLTRMIEKANK